MQEERLSSPTIISNPCPASTKTFLKRQKNVFKNHNSPDSTKWLGQRWQLHWQIRWANVVWWVGARGQLVIANDRFNVGPTFCQPICQPFKTQNDANLLPTAANRCQRWPNVAPTRCAVWGTYVASRFFQSPPKGGHSSYRNMYKEKFQGTCFQLLWSNHLND